MNCPTRLPAGYGSSRIAALCALALVAAGCTAGTKPSALGNAGTTGGPGGGGGSGGSAGTTGRGGAPPGVGGQAGTGTNPDAGSCQQKVLKFERQIPTVFLLVDRSGSVFVNDTTGIYFTLRSAALEVIEQLQAEVRFGLGVFTGPTASQCVLQFDTVAAELNNYAAIAERYNALNRPTSGKLNTPAVQALPMVKTMLQGDMSPGKKYVLFVTDSETDYCDDGNPLCPLDSVTYLIEDLYAAGIGTFVLGLPSDQSQYAMNALQGFANAGAGLPAPPPMQTGIYDQCQGTAGWRTIWTAAGRTGNVPTATYQAGVMTAPLFTPDPNNRTALANAIASVIQGVKSCTFDLDEFKINLARLNEASVMIEGVAVPLDATKTNGWYMNSATQLELYGQTCTDWRNPDVDDIRFDFPCDIIVD